MSALALLGWGGLLTALAMLLFLGAAPVFIVRLAARLYPRGSQMRHELPAEMAWVAQRDGFMRRWQWLGQTLATALCDGPTQRRRARQADRQALQHIVPAPIDISLLQDDGTMVVGQFKFTRPGTDSTSWTGILLAPDGSAVSEDELARASMTPEAHRQIAEAIARWHRRPPR